MRSIEVVASKRRRLGTNYVGSFIFRAFLAMPGSVTFKAHVERNTTDYQTYRM